LIISGAVPKVLKAAHVLPLHKGGDLSDLKNYRPISKLSSLSNILESLINCQLRSFLATRCVHQSGFRQGHGTIYAANLVLTDAAKGMDRRKHCAALFIDISKAFEAVDQS
jgi:hypothetical protein